MLDTILHYLGLAFGAWIYICIIVWGIWLAYKMKDI